MADAEPGVHSSTGYWVTRLARAMESDLEKRLAVHGVARATWALLGAIVYDEKTSPSSLSSFIGIDRAATTRHLDRMVEKGLISRDRDLGDRRRINLEVTAKGKRLAAKLAADSRATNERFLGDLGPKQAEAFHKTIRRMLSNRDVVLRDI